VTGVQTCALPILVPTNGDRGRSAPRRLERARTRTLLSVERVIAQAFAPLDPVALAVALGVIAALVMLIVSTITLLTGGPYQRSLLSLLASYFPGFRVGWTRVPLGCAEAGAWGYGLGYVTAALRNQGLAAYGWILQRRGAPQFTRRDGRAGR